MVRQGQAPFGMVSVDDMDRKIIAGLRGNARRTAADIAREVGVSEPTIRNRIDRLVQTGVILVSARVNPEALGLPVDVMIGVRVERGQMTEVGEQLGEIPHVSYVGFTTGTFDILMEAHFRDKEALYEFINGDLAAVTGITHSETWHILRTQKYNTEWAGEDVIETFSLNDVHEENESWPEDVGEVRKATKSRSTRPKSNGRGRK